MSPPDQVEVVLAYPAFLTDIIGHPLGCLVGALHMLVLFVLLINCVSLNLLILMRLHLICCLVRVCLILMVVRVWQILIYVLLWSLDFLYIFALCSLLLLLLCMLLLPTHRLSPSSACTTSLFIRSVMMVASLNSFQVWTTFSKLFSKVVLILEYGRFYLVIELLLQFQILSNQSLHLQTQVV